MNLTQSVGIIMGADIGTTITAQLVSINLTALAPFSIALGVVINLSTKNPKIKKYSEILIGFGILFLGMDIMKSACKPLRSYEPFTSLLTRFGSGTPLDTFLAIGTGFLVTGVIQSSSATTGIMIALAAAGLLSIESAFPVLLGANIGTCITALLSSIGTKRVAKRAALIHLTIKIIGTTIFALFLSGFTVDLVQRMSDDPARQIAWAHTLFNVINTAILLPFAPLIVKFVFILLPQQDTKEEQDYSLALDDRMMETPYIALEQIRNEISVMGGLAKTSFDNAMGGFISNTPSKIEEIFETEKKINKMEEEIIHYLVKLSNASLSIEQRETIDSLFNVVSDIERVGDHAENIAELLEYKFANKISFSDQAISELQDIYGTALNAVHTSLESFQSDDENEARKVIALEDRIDELEKTLKKTHIKRLTDGLCQPKSSILFLELINNIERVGDHAMNIAEIQFLDA